MATQLNSFLARYANFELPHGALRQFTTKIIKEELGVLVPSSKISLVRGRLVLETSHLIKNEIALHKDTLLERLRQEYGPKAPQDIG